MSTIFLKLKTCLKWKMCVHEQESLRLHFISISQTDLIQHITEITICP